MHFLAFLACHMKPAGVTLRSTSPTGSAPLERKGGWEERQSHACHAGPQGPYINWPQNAAPPSLTAQLSACSIPLLSEGLLQVLIQPCTCGYSGPSLVFKSFSVLTPVPGRDCFSFGSRPVGSRFLLLGCPLAEPGLWAPDGSFSSEQ